jgi:sugar phosphate isomerase/epimerase
MSYFEEGKLSRRNLLKSGAALGLTVMAGIPIAGAKDTGASPYAGLRMGVQSYSFRSFSLEKALQMTKKLGLHYWEAYPGHIPMSALPKKIADVSATVAAQGVAVMAYGVVDFDSNENKAREKFEFAKAMHAALKNNPFGVSAPYFALSANPQKNKQTFDLLERLVIEYDIRIAIHNHGPGARYDKIVEVLNVLKDRHPYIGACVDTGHYLRSDEDPVDALQQFGDRLYGVHIKDVRTVVDANGNRKKVFTVLGKGDLDILGCLRVLKRLKYDGSVSLEYEENADNPYSDVADSLEAVRQAAKKLG